PLARSRPLVPTDGAWQQPGPVLCPSVKGHPAVDMNGLTGDETTVITDQKQAGGGNFLWRPLTSQGNARGIWCPPLVPFRIGTRGVDTAWAHHIDPNILWRELGS